ncbi:DUF742 domain-containing protein [Streptomyces profundus]|uniref:DUF742 domain-containing protein n=1 Tax=Streptomyces profundus TaxID=2867410 RepID=UPI001D166C47|nr:DUF742 domain-containing protein [Streptomyces sp. MA3_2.13]UED85152.1 DUF742 domain-containing protein [Streptomyces sp. MA3_2.13]
MSRAPRRRLVPAYLVTGGRPVARRPDLERLTVLVLVEPPGPGGGLGPEHRGLCALLEPGALSLVECAAHLRLPVSATVILAADLIERGHLHARPPVPPAQEIDRSLVERLLVGLRALR